MSVQREKARLRAARWRKNLTPEKRAAYLARRREHWLKMHPGARINCGSGNGRHWTLGLTGDALAAHRYAKRRDWLERNRAKKRAYDKARLAEKRRDPQFRERERLYFRLWVARNWQRVLASNRSAYQRRRDLAGLSYTPRLSARVPDWVRSRGELQELARRGYAHFFGGRVSVGRAIQSGLSVGRFNSRKVK